MKSRILALTLLLVACTRSQSVSPIPAQPPVTVIGTLPSTPQIGATPTVLSPTTSATPTPAVASDRLPLGAPADVPLPAPGGEWSLWRRGIDAGQLFRADASGQVVEIRLPALADTRPSPEFALSPDGQLIFYTLLDAGGGVIARYLAAYEFSTGVLQTAAMDKEHYGLVDYGALQAAFDPDGTQIAVTLEGNEEKDNTKTSFRVFLWDLKTNKIADGLTPETPVDRDLLPKDHIPVVIRWTPEGILLVGHLYQSANYSKTLLWKPEGHDIAAAPEASSAFAFSGQRLDGGSEVVWPDYDQTYPTLPLDCWGKATPNNVVKYSDLAGGKPTVIFASGASEQVASAQWLDGGERLALLMIDCNRKATRVVVLDRTGATTNAMPVSGKPAIFASGSKLIALDENLETSATAIVAYDGSDKWAAHEIKAFTGTLGSAGYAFEFITKQTARTGLKPFPEVGAEVSRSGLTVGKHATVQFSGGPIFFRTKPDPDAPAVGLLAPGTEVVLVDGPVTAKNGLVYWQVRKIEDNLVGWCVEAFEGEQTLIPKP
ncbi:MAG: hypothetical protein HY260_22265 [Chloroflexi bacterium]|nr:hypothetical protein [Chloroflexota bacterium]